MVEVDAAKLQELKLKYGISILDMEEIAGAVINPEGPIELESPLPPLPQENPVKTNENPIMGNEMGGQSALMTALRSGDSSMQDVLGIVIVMDYLERMQERREQRAGGMGGGSDVTQLRDEMRRDREDLNQKFSDLIGTFEKTMLGKERDEAVDRANRLQDNINQRADHDKLQGAVDDAVGKVVNYYEDQIQDLRGAIGHLSPDQQKGFFAELFDEIGDEVKSDVKEQFLDRLRGKETQNITKTDEEGKTTINYGHFLDRTIDLLETFATGKEKRPPLSKVNRMDTRRRAVDDTQSFLDDRGEEDEEVIHIVPSEAASDANAEVEEVSQEIIEEIPKPIIEEAHPGPIIHGGLDDRARARARREAKTSIPLEEISGIGPKIAEDLRGLGINDVKALMTATPEDLEQKLSISGVSFNKAADWIAQAKDRMDSE